MSRNPYDPPGDFRSQSEISKSPGEIEKKSNPLRQSIRFSLVAQLLSLTAASLMLDGGRFFRSVLVATLLFWFFTIAMILPRRKRLSESNLLFVKWGYFGFLFAVILQMLW